MDANVIDRVAARCSASGIPLTRSGVATVADYFEEERSRDCDANGLRSVDQGLGVHDDHMLVTEAQDHA